MVTRDLAKVETAGSSPVYRSYNEKRYPSWISLFRYRSVAEPLTRGAASCLRSTPVGAEQTSPGRLAPVYRSYNEKRYPSWISLFRYRSVAEPLTRGAASCLRSTPVGAEQTSPGRLAPVYRSYNEKRYSSWISLFCYRSVAEPLTRAAASCLRSTPVGAEQFINTTVLSGIVNFFKKI